MRFVLLKESVKGQRVLDLCGSQSEQLGDLDDRLQWDVPQLLVDDVQRRQGDRLPRRIPLQMRLDPCDHVVCQNPSVGRHASPIDQARQR